MDTDNDLQAIIPADIAPGMRIRAKNGDDVIVEGVVSHVRDGEIWFGPRARMRLHITIYGWKFYRVYDGSEVNRAY